LIGKQLGKLRSFQLQIRLDRIGIKQLPILQIEISATLELELILSESERGNVRAALGSIDGRDETVDALVSHFEVRECEIACHPRLSDWPGNRARKECRAGVVQIQR
jgi:hypothetical protein